jgi:hypothetical protein
VIEKHGWTTKAIAERFEIDELNLFDFLNMNKYDPAIAEKLVHLEQFSPVCDGECIRCPKCGSINTHTHGVGTLVGSDEAEAVVYLGTNPIGKTPSRRSALSITMSCEHCPGTFSLVIQQHKGTNFIAWQ